MNWDLFFKSLGTLSENISASSSKKEEVNNILVEHNIKAEQDFLNRLTNRKQSKLISRSDNIGGIITMTNQKRISEKELKRLREEFTPGTPVVLEQMDDPYTNMPTGMKGIVRTVDDTGTIFVHWDNGSGLGVAYGEDRCRVDEGESQS